MRSPSGVRLQSGGVAIAFRVEFLLTREELISALLWNQRNLANEPMPPLSSTRVVAIIRETLRNDGELMIGYWSDSYSEHQAEIWYAWASALVDATFGSALDVARAGGAR